MNLIASCPACQTSYRVVPDQLRISDGWVRCGQCGEVFDVSQQLVDAKAETSGAEAFESSENLVEAYPLNPENQQISLLPTRDSPALQEATVPPASEASWASAAMLVKPSHESGSDVSEPTATSLAPLSFMLASDSTSVARRRSGPVLCWGLGGLLLVGLLLQGVFRERDCLTAMFPELKPALVSLCEVLDCRVSALQDIESLAIDSASFHQVGQDSFELRFVVKNKSRFELALPAIELTLTDMADQPVMRRVFTPAELGVAQGTVASAGEWSATAYLRVRAEATDARAQGYRLLIFYP